jgi:hypothetical protein
MPMLMMLWRWNEEMEGMKELQVEAIHVETLQMPAMVMIVGGRRLEHSGGASYAHITWEQAPQQLASSVL